MPTKETIKSFWNQAADENPQWYISSYGSYDADRNPDEFWASGRAIWTDIKRVSGYLPSPGHQVVEIGCGIGRVTRAIAPEVGGVIALDISEKMLAMARKANLSNVDFRPAEGFALPGIPDESVDLSLAYCVFQHLPTLEALKSYLSEMRRITKRKGMIAFTLSERDWSTWLLPAMRVRAYFRERLSRGGPKGVYRKEWVGIRPSNSDVSRMIDMRFEHHSLGGGRDIYFARKEM
jgi:SAM-dependent methyltransferase